jgi:outer membrane scaffolding protein for murein synthesis (MipA/OmpV family)
MVLSLLAAPSQPWPTMAQTPAEPDRQPLWEFGAFVGSTRMPYYRGSDEYRVYVIPLPYLIYRGEIFQSDREGVRGIFFATDRLDTSVSLSGNPPVNDGVDARRGMPDLGPVGEIGPALKWYFHDRRARQGLCLQFAARPAASIDDGEVHYRGLHGGVNLIFNGERRQAGLRYGANLGVDLADAEYNQYFYGVSPEYSSPDRPAYAASAGYGGFGCSTYVVFPIADSISAGIYARWDNLHGAVFEDSPLVRTENNITLGAMLVWELAKSQRTVPWRRDLGR